MKNHYSQIRFIGHLNTDFGKEQNHIHGKSSSKINVLLSAAGWTLMKMIELLK